MSSVKHFSMASIKKKFENKGKVDFNDFYD